MSEIDKKNILRMTYDEVVAWMRGFDSRAKIVHAICHTEPRMNKTGNPFHGRITKVSEGNGVLNWIYANAVVKGQGKSGVEEPEFTPQPRKWGQRIQGTPLVEHLKDGRLQYYCELKWSKPPEVSYLLDGRFSIDEAEFREFMPRPNLAQIAEHQGVDVEFVVRVTDYHVSAIRQIHADGFVIIQV